MCSSNPEFVLTGVIYIENALKGTEIVFVLTAEYRTVLLTRFYCMSYELSCLYYLQITLVR